MSKNHPPFNLEQFRDFDRRSAQRQLLDGVSLADLDKETKQRKADIANAAYPAIMGDPKLTHARQVLSVYEFRMIIDHVISAAVGENKPASDGDAS